ncbi:glucose-1-phosphate thymidylyltransferase [Actinoplanes sp. NPDC004185]
MKALVLAGGSGTRLRPFSHSLPKQLIPVANRAVLSYVLGNVRAAGVTEVGIIVSNGAEAIRQAFGDGADHGMRLTYLTQSQPLGLAHAVRVARPFLGVDDFVVHLGDNMLADGIAETVARFRRDRPAAHLVVQKVADPRAFGVVELDARARVRRLVEKPSEPRSDLALVGVYVFTAAVHAAVDAITPSARGELELTDAVQWLVDRGADVRADEYAGFWKDVGTVADVLECNRYMLGGQWGRIDGRVDTHSTIGPGVVVEAGASVVRSRIQGPAIVGAGALVEDSLLGPHTAVGAGCRVRGSEVADSVLLEGASVTAVLRLVGSILGRGAVVTGGGSAGHRLVLGDHGAVTLDP